MPMSIDYEPARRRYRVRWREAGSQRSRRFLNRSDAEAFAASLQPAPEPPPAPPPAEPDGSGIYAYATTAGPRWRLLYRQSDGTLTTPRGFESRAAAVAARAAAIEAGGGGRPKGIPRATFAECWSRFLELKRPYVTAGTLQDYVTRRSAGATDVVGILPNDCSLIRLAGMLCIEQNDKWLVGRGYLSAESISLVITGPGLD